MTDLDYEMMRAGAAGMARICSTRLARAPMRRSAEPIIVRKNFMKTRLLPMVRTWVSRNRSFADG